MAFDDRARVQAIRNLAPKSAGGKGQVVDLLRPASGGAYNTATGKKTGGTPPVTQHGSGIEESYRAHQIDGTLIKAGDKRFMLSPVQTDGADLVLPEVGQHLVYGTGTRWRIMAVEPYAPTGLLIYVYLQLRGV